MLDSTTYKTYGGVEITRSVSKLPADQIIDELKDNLRNYVGAYFSSGYEYPGRYSRWDIGFYAPPLELRARGRSFEFIALNEKGGVLLDFIAQALENHPHLIQTQRQKDRLSGQLKPMPDFFPEEERSRQPSLFSLLRSLISYFGSKEDTHLGFYGAFGYDLVFQFEPIDLKHERKEALDCHLFIPDQIAVVDRRLDQAMVIRYDFSQDGQSTKGLSRESKKTPSFHPKGRTGGNDHPPGAYAKKVKQVQEGCKRGDFFEVVLSQVFSLPYEGEAVDLLKRIQKRNPSPYEFFIHLGEEQLVGASPEMFVRVDGDRVETCPISGTVPRGESPMEDADNIRQLLSSDKEEAELTMCTDVDRNDKSRVCRPETVKLLARRLIETYSKVIHTVDHVEGRLQEGRDGLDAFLSHMWAVTLSGSPKRAAMQTIENLEESSRAWYGGAVGILGFDGNINTGITIRTVYLKDGLAKVRVGATLLAASDPDSEELETEFKAEAFLKAVSQKSLEERVSEKVENSQTYSGKKVLFVDHQDSFVHTLAGYVRRTGAEVLTLRSGFPISMIDEFKPDLIFLSPGPFNPDHFGLPQFVLEMMKRKLPIFGVCLGLQGIVQALGGELGVLDIPQHGVGAKITHRGQGIFKGLENPMKASRYHSLYAIQDKLPECLEVTANSDDGVIQAIAHKSYPLAAVQFHPESIHSLRGGLGLKLIEGMMRELL